MGLSIFKKCWMTAIATTIVFGCGPKTPSFVAPPPPDVTVSAPLKQEVTDFLEFTGNTKPLEAVEIRARVQGFLDRDGVPARSEGQGW